MSLNLVTLVGRAGRDPEVRNLDNNTSVCKFSLAVNRMKKDEPPDWFELEMWGKTADIAKNYVRKGGLIGVQGSLKMDSWTDRTSGAPRSRPIIRVDKLDLLGSKRDNEAHMASRPQEDEF